MQTIERWSIMNSKGCRRKHLLRTVPKFSRHEWKRPQKKAVRILCPRRDSNLALQTYKSAWTNFLVIHVYK